MLSILRIRSGDGLRMEEDMEAVDDKDVGEDSWYRERGVGVGGEDGQSEEEAGEGSSEAV